jgi:hypothetical protein
LAQLMSSRVGGGDATRDSYGTEHGWDGCLAPFFLLARDVDGHPGE